MKHNGLFRLSLTIITAAYFTALTSCTHGSKSAEVSYDCSEPVEFVSTLVGTMSSHGLSTGNTYPAIARPWGTNFWTPQTGKNGNGWAYVYTDPKIRGIKQTHQPSPWINDYGQFSIMPVTTGPVFDENERASWFSHKAETATPYYYSVYLADHDATIEVTPTEHAAEFRITYPEMDQSYLVIDAFDRGSWTEIRPSENKIVGYTVRNSGGVTDNFKNWFVIVCDTPFEYTQTIDENGHAGAIVGFKTSKGQKVCLKAASSFISLEQAETNMLEVAGKDFDTVREEGRAAWNSTLGRIRIEDGDLDHLRTFYSCLYRCVLFPRDLSEVTAEGKRVHYSPYDGDVHEGYLFGDTGFWDTFRSLFALVDLVYPEMAEKMQEGLANDYLESGFLPEWSSPGHRGCMVGNNSASVVAEAYLKGIRTEYTETLWEALCHGAHAVHPRVLSTGRLGWEYYDRLGYVPCNVGINESAARTLEYAYDDWCIWRFGQEIGKSDAETAPYLKASYNYRNLYRKADALMGGRNEDGSFPEEFSRYKWGGDFTEGNSLHYTWSVFHDPKGLIELMGGDEAFAANLDAIYEIPPIFDDSYYGGTIHEIREMQVMNMGNYAHGNQPIQHVTYLYDWCGQPWKTQFHVREAMEKLYTAAPDGYCGDEDNGQTSAWYVFSALGFYPVCPASCEYAAGTPLFRKATVNLPSGKKIRISAPANSRKAYYVSGMKLNGKSYDCNFFRHCDLVKGADITFNMSETASSRSGKAPYSLSDEK
ncbi:MAG: GH92 family glycosyl hydrolase [Bacteroidales bacterium]|nr:GH92 family glycosyl hydrolase [Bacteroidales bacterium]